MIHQKEIEEKIKHDIEETVTVNPEQLKILVDEAVKIKLSDKDLEILENTLLNPPKPNDNLKRAAEKYKETLDEINDELDEEIDGLIPDSSIEPYSLTHKKKEIEEPEKLNIDTERLKVLENFLSKFEQKNDIDNDSDINNPVVGVSNEDIWKMMDESDETKVWDVTVADGLEDEPPYEDVFDGDYSPMQFEEDYFLGNDGKHSEIDDLSDISPIEPIESSDIRPIEPIESSDNCPIEPSDIDKKKENTTLEDPILVVEEDKKKDQLDTLYPEENIQFLPLEETQDLTNNENSLYFDRDINSSNINRKIVSRNVNNTRRRGFS
jgi:hypothetical protein